MFVEVPLLAKDRLRNAGYLKYKIPHILRTIILRTTILITQTERVANPDCATME